MMDSDKKFGLFNSRSCKKVLYLAVAGIMLMTLSVMVLSKLKSDPHKIRTSNAFQHTLPQRTHQISKGSLDGCYHVYLDVGSNIGVQVRKLFQPELYPDATISTLFDANFGEDRVRRKDFVCSVGFEPNPHHTKILQEIETAYQRCGWNAKFFTETGVSNHDGEGNFFSDDDFQNKEWGGGVLPPELFGIAKEPKSTVTLVRLSNFIIANVGNRTLPAVDEESMQGKKPVVMMKIDIEGSEVDVVPDLIFSGALQHVNILMIEWHDRFQKVPKRLEASKALQDALNALSKYSAFVKGDGGSFEFHLVDLDDETYYLDDFKPPDCFKGT